MVRERAITAYYVRCDTISIYFKLIFQLSKLLRQWLQRLLSFGMWRLFVSKKLTSSRKNLLPRCLWRFAKHAVTRHKRDVFRFMCTKTLCLWQTCTPVFRRVTRVAKKTSINLVISVCPSTWNNSVPTGRIFVKFNIWVVFLFENQSRKLKSP